MITSKEASSPNKSMLERTMLIPRIIVHARSWLGDYSWQNLQLQNIGLKVRFEVLRKRKYKGGSGRIIHEKNLKCKP